MGEEWEARGLESAGREGGVVATVSMAGRVLCGVGGCWVVKHDGAPPWCAAVGGPYSKSGGDRLGARPRGEWGGEVAGVLFGSPGRLEWIVSDMKSARRRMMNRFSL